MRVYTRKPVLERFEALCIPEPNSGCWIWFGATQRGGYGCINIDRKTTAAHRLSYKLYKGDIPDEALICHTCDNKACVNPDHLYVGDHSLNAWDAIDRGLWPRRDGEYAGRAKLTVEQVLAIRAHPRFYGINVHLAKVYNMSPQQILAVRQRRAWAHI